MRIVPHQIFSLENKDCHTDLTDSEKSNPLCLCNRAIAFIRHINMKWRTKFKYDLNIKNYNQSVSTRRQQNHQTHILLERYRERIQSFIF